MAPDRKPQRLGETYAGDPGDEDAEREEEPLVADLLLAVTESVAELIEKTAEHDAAECSWHAQLREFTYGWAYDGASYIRDRDAAREAFGAALLALIDSRARR